MSVVPCPFSDELFRSTHSVTTSPGLDREVAGYVVIQVELRDLGRVDGNLGVDQLSVVAVTRHGRLDDPSRKAAGNRKLAHIAIHCWQLGNQDPHLNPGVAESWSCRALVNMAQHWVDRRHGHGSSLRIIGAPAP